MYPCETCPPCAAYYRVSSKEFAALSPRGLRRSLRSVALFGIASNRLVVHPRLSFPGSGDEIPLRPAHSVYWFIYTLLAAYSFYLQGLRWTPSTIFIRCSIIEPLCRTIYGLRPVKAAAMFVSPLLSFP